MQLMPQNIPQHFFFSFFFASCHSVVNVRGIIVVTIQLACVTSVFGEINNISLFSSCFASPATSILGKWMIDAVQTALAMEPSFTFGGNK